MVQARFHGTWSFEWVLDGRAIQDVLVAPGRETGSDRPGERNVGTTLRYLDPELGQWHVVWLGATTGVVARLTGRAVADEIWIEAEDEGVRYRWVFTEIGPTSFRWKGMVSLDGVEWTLVQEMSASRAPE